MSEPYSRRERASSAVSGAATSRIASRSSVSTSARTSTRSSLWSSSRISAAASGPTSSIASAAWLRGEALDQEGARLGIEGVEQLGEPFDRQMRGDMRSVGLGPAHEEGLGRLALACLEVFLEVEPGCFAHFQDSCDSPGRGYQTRRRFARWMRDCTVFPPAIE